MITILCSSLILGGCANTASGYRPIIDGYQGAAYEADLADCKSLAKTRDYDNDDTKSGLLAGAALGGVIGAIDDDSVEGILAGVLGGAIAGGIGGAVKTRTDRKHIVIRCMDGRGHPVVG